MTLRTKKKTCLFSILKIYLRARVDGDAIDTKTSRNPQTCGTTIMQSNIYVSCTVHRLLCTADNKIHAADA